MLQLARCPSRSLSRRHSHGRRSVDIAATVCAHLEQHHAECVSLAELASLVGVSAYHVSRVMRRTVGMPPHVYLSHVRVRRAQALLANGASLSMVTHATGFFDQSHFTRTFKRIVGIPPGQYAREAMRPVPTQRFA